MDSDQESSECPLCLEALEADDMSFFPCTCCYQICRFCWHRIRTDENGLCPACRKPYSENPAQFKPLSEEEIQQVKRDRKLKDSHKKPKITESRKHLANLRVVQRNLVFVNGLPARLADTELLRRNDHFGKYGKIVKLVTSPAHNGQVNSICVYITYSRSEEALRAIQSLCNYHVDGRTLKATLGTTKYCSRYLKGAVCQKTDCLYLHEPGDPLASFTKEQMQQGLHLEYERKLMEHYANKAAAGTPTSSRTMTNGHKNDSSQRGKLPLMTPLLTATTDSNTMNGSSDLESAEKITHMITTTSNLHALNGYSNGVFGSTAAHQAERMNGGDSDSSSTSSQTSSEHDPTSRVQHETYNASPATNWPEENASMFASNNLAPSSQSTSTSSSTRTLLHSPKNTRAGETNGAAAATATVNHNDPLPEYKLFGSNAPSIHTILFGNTDNSQSISQSHRPLTNGIDHELEDIERRLMENGLGNVGASAFLHAQENDELGFDPCSLFMSALASDIEDERRPLPSISSSHSYRPASNAFAYSLQYNPTTNSQPMGQVSSSWMMPQQQQQQQQQYHPYHEQPQQPTTPQKQSRYQPPFNGSSSPRQMWNGNQSQQYPPQIPTRLDFSNQQQQQQQQQRQSSPSTQYPQIMNQTYPANNAGSNERWMNGTWTDPAIISHGNKVESLPSQWSTTTSSPHGSSGLSSGNNLMSTSRWSQPQSHMLTNGIYMPYSTTTATSSIEDRNHP